MHRAIVSRKLLRNKCTETDSYQTYYQTQCLYVERLRKKRSDNVSRIMETIILKKNNFDFHNGRIISPPLKTH